MKFYDASLIIVLILLLVSSIGVISIQFLGNDNLIEEISEEIIEIETGKEIDLSPGEENAIQK